MVIHCRGTASTAKKCMWIMKSNLQKDQIVYWHHFNETEEMAREVEVAFPNVVFGVAPAILKEKLDDQLEKFIRSTSSERLMAESDAPMVGERRATNHPLAAGDRFEKNSSNHVRPTAYNEEDMSKQLPSFVRARRVVVREFVGGVIFRPGRGMNYFMVFNFTCMHCGDLNSAHKDF